MGAIRIYIDVRSGRSIDRLGLQSLPASAGKSDTLAVVRLDCLGWSLGELLATVTMLMERGVALLSLAKKIGTSSAGEPVPHVLGVIAHFERQLIAKRTKDGIVAARARDERAAQKSLAAGLSPTAAARQLGLV